jgi:hypothetical protein
MALAYDAVSGQYSDTGQPNSWTHSPSGTPKAVLVSHATPGNSVNVTSITYGGVSMTKVLDGGNANRTVSVWFLGSSIPTGDQTVTINQESSANQYGYCTTLTAAAGNSTRVAGSGQNWAVAGANPSVTITSISGASYGYGVVISDAAYNAITAGSGMTLRKNDGGTMTKGSAIESSTSEQASGDMVVAFTCAKYTALIGVAVEEFTEVSGAVRPTLLTLGVGQ